VKDSFLYKLAVYIKENDLLSRDVKIILPNKRGGLFLKKELTALIDSSEFLPLFLSIEEFSQSLTDLTLLDTIHLQFELYKTYIKIIPKTQRDPFDKFIQWAPTVLQDFNDIDSYLVNPKKLYDNLSALKRIESWEPNKPPTNLSLNYLSFFRMLNKLYESFYERLLEKQQAYQGLIYREAVKNISLYCNNISERTIIFAGFNALNKAEELIIQELLENQKAKIFWDVDSTLLSTKHPATKFITHYIKTWPYYKDNEFNWESNSFKLSKKIQFIGAAKNVSQLKTAGKILKSISEKEESLSNTTLVLGNENLLGVALESLPEEVNKANITMGYSLQNIPLASLFSVLFLANIRSLKFKKAEEFYYKDVEKILRHPYFLKLTQLNKNTSEKLVQHIHKNSLSFVNYKKLKFYLNIKHSDTDFIFKPTGDKVSEFLNNCIRLINICKECKTLSDIENEYLYRFYKLFTTLESLETKYHFINNLKTLQHFYKRLLQNEKLFFEGEPLSGLQIMGMLETRALDFKNVIITSVNEGILPAKKSSNSFLPFAIKKAYGLPTYHEKDIIFSYHFFGLLQRAKSIYLIYNTEIDDFGASEQSRFLTQLELLKPTDITKYTARSKVKSKSLNLRKINVNQIVKKELKALAENGLSPTAVTIFKKNPLDFYYNYILKIKDVITLDETIAYNTFGTVIHDTLQQLYTPYLNQNLNQNSLESIDKNILEVLNFNFKKTYKGGNLETGKNKLYFEMAKNYIQKLLAHEKQLVIKGQTLKIIELEKALETIIKVPNISYSIKIKGKADRIDLVDGKLRIIDYKTGAVEASKLKIYDFDSLIDDENHNIALQLFMYAFMYSKNNEFLQEFRAGVISFKKMNNYISKINFKSNSPKPDFNITKERLGTFEISFQRLLQNIFNAETFIEKIKNHDYY
jgi:ATP-dependent helicase/nuclease subunit B